MPPFTAIFVTIFMLTSHIWTISKTLQNCFGTVVSIRRGYAPEHHDLHIRFSKRSLAMPPSNCKLLEVQQGHFCIFLWAKYSDVSVAIEFICKGVMKYTSIAMVFWFLAATKQLYKWYFPSVCLSVCPCPSVRLSHLFDYVPIIVSSSNFQELLLMTKVRSMQKDKVRGQRSRSQRSRPNLTVSGL